MNEPELSDVLQAVFDRNLTLHSLCILEHCARHQIIPTMPTCTPFRVCSERMFDILTTYNFSECDFLMVWSKETLPCLVQEEYVKEGLNRNRKCVIRKFCKTLCVVTENGVVQSEGTHIIQEEQDESKLKTLLFSCIQFSKTFEIKNILSIAEHFVNAKDKKGRTPIVYAAELKHKDTVLLLAENGADISIAADDGTLLIDLIHEWNDVIQALMKVNLYIDL